MPYARLLGSSASSSVTFRCCMSLRPNTLKKRIKDWEPVRRFMLGQYGVPFPKDAQQVLAYLEVREAEQAPMSTFGDVHDALKYLEEAGSSRCN